HPVVLVNLALPKFHFQHALFPPHAHQVGRLYPMTDHPPEPSGQRTLHEISRLRPGRMISPPPPPTRDNSAAPRTRSPRGAPHPPTPGVAHAPPGRVTRSPPANSPRPSGASLPGTPPPGGRRTRSASPADPPHPDSAPPPRPNTPLAP